ncbi:MAG: hypothetical protein KAT65_10325 [Methanophagales archaeon]|nr:hypothetical protein [Methanophagales archaeon]
MRRKTKQQKGIEKSVSPSLMASALREMFNRLTDEEKREFIKTFDWDEIEEIKSEDRLGREDRICGDPKIYIGTTSSGLTFEIPEDKVAGFLQIICQYLLRTKVEIFAQLEEGTQEMLCSNDEFLNLINKQTELFLNNSVMIEFDGHSLITGGGGCFSLELLDAPSKLKRDIAEKILHLCGFDYRFKMDEFSAVVWEDKLEVRDNEERC